MECRTSRRIRGDGLAIGPWLVLAAELSLERSAARTIGERGSRRCEGSRRHPAALLALGDPTRRCEPVGLSTHARTAARCGRRGDRRTVRRRGPSEDLELRAIPGVGDSVAKMVLCFGHGRAAVPLHSAAARVATRVAGSEHRRRWQLRLDLHRLAGPAGPDAAFNAAVTAARHDGLPSGRSAMRRVPARADCATAPGDPARRRDLEAGRVSGTEMIPSARRLMESLRDIGYDLSAAVADLVDNSLDADAENVTRRHRT